MSATARSEHRFVARSHRLAEEESNRDSEKEILQREVLAEAVKAFTCRWVIPGPGRKNLDVYLPTDAGLKLVSRVEGAILHDKVTGRQYQCGWPGQAWQAAGCALPRPYIGPAERLGWALAWSPGWAGACPRPIVHVEVPGGSISAGYTNRSEGDRFEVIAHGCAPLALEGTFDTSAELARWLWSWPVLRPSLRAFVENKEKSALPSD